MSERPDYIASIRRIVIAANPEITELKFGCVFQVKDDGKVFTCIDAKIMERAVNNEVSRFASVVFMDSKGTLEGAFDRNEIEIIGRLIRLTDVLLAISKTGYANMLLSSMIHKDGEFGIFEFSWDLKNDDLEKQSDACISVVHSLLE